MSNDNETIDGDPRVVLVTKHQSRALRVTRGMSAATGRTFVCDRTADRTRFRVRRAAREGLEADRAVALALLALYREDEERGTARPLPEQRPAAAAAPRGTLPATAVRQAARAQLDAADAEARRQEVRAAREEAGDAAGGNGRQRVRMAR